MQLLPDDGSIYPKVIAGTIAQIAHALFLELQSTGSSLLEDDVLNSCLVHVKHYASHAVLSCQRRLLVATEIDKNIILQGFEWSIIDPVIRAHCDLNQAKLVEGSRSMGGDGFGMTVSEALQIYNDQRERLPRNAYIEPPFSFATLDGN